MCCFILLLFYYCTFISIQGHFEQKHSLVVHHARYNPYTLILIPSTTTAHSMQVLNLLCDRKQPKCTPCAPGKKPCVYPSEEINERTFHPAEDPEPLFVNSDLAPYNENLIKTDFLGIPFSRMHAHEQVKQLDSILPANDIPADVLVDLLQEQHAQDKQYHDFNPFLGNRLACKMEFGVGGGGGRFGSGLGRVALMLSLFVACMLYTSKPKSIDSLIFTPTGPNLNDLSLFRIPRSTERPLSLRNLQRPEFCLDVGAQILQIEVLPFPTV